jgi:hormone-sensitive lipase
MSSGSHQNYTRSWAKSLPNAVVCSLDYRLAPESRFPNQLDDIWQAYYWLVVNAKTILGREPRKIILAGDSAGGNLILALTVMAI